MKIKIRPEIQKFAEYMEATMRKHDKDIIKFFIKNQHMIDREDLKELFKKKTNEALESNMDSEFIDIANLCMMIVNSPLKPRTARCPNCQSNLKQINGKVKIGIQIQEKE